MIFSDVDAELLDKLMSIFGTFIDKVIEIVDERQNDVKVEWLLLQQKIYEERSDTDMIFNYVKRLEFSKDRWQQNQFRSSSKQPPSYVNQKLQQNSTDKSQQQSTSYKYVFTAKTPNSKHFNPPTVNSEKTIRTEINDADNMMSQEQQVDQQNYKQRIASIHKSFQKLKLMQLSQPHEKSGSISPSQTIPTGNSIIDSELSLNEPKFDEQDLIRNNLKNIIIPGRTLGVYQDQDQLKLNPETQTDNFLRTTKSNSNLIPLNNIESESASQHNRINSNLVISNTPQYGSVADISGNLNYFVSNYIRPPRQQAEGGAHQLNHFKKENLNINNNNVKSKSIHTIGKIKETYLIKATNKDDHRNSVQNNSNNKMQVLEEGSNPDDLYSVLKSSESFQGTIPTEVADDSIIEEPLYKKDIYREVMEGYQRNQDKISTNLKQEEDFDRSNDIDTVKDRLDQVLAKIKLYETSDLKLQRKLSEINLAHAERSSSANRSQSPQQENLEQKHTEQVLERLHQIKIQPPNPTQPVKQNLVTRINEEIKHFQYNSIFLNSLPNCKKVEGEISQDQMDEVSFEIERTQIPQEKVNLKAQVTDLKLLKERETLNPKQTPTPIRSVAKFNSDNKSNFLLPPTSPQKQQSYYISPSTNNSNTQRSNRNPSNSPNTKIPIPQFLQVYHDGRQYQNLNSPTNQQHNYVNNQPQSNTQNQELSHQQQNLYQVRVNQNVNQLIATHRNYTQQLY